MEQTRAGFLLDEAACGKDASGALQEACRILPGTALITNCRCRLIALQPQIGVFSDSVTAFAGIAGADLPLSFVTALADRGALAAALVVQQARLQPAPAASDRTQTLQEAEALLHIAMHFGLVHEAFCQVSRETCVALLLLHRLHDS